VGQDQNHGGSLVFLGNMGKSIKCEKCSLRFKDREDSEDYGVYADLCFNCRFIWRTIGAILQGLPEKLNRQVTIRLEDVLIECKKKRNAIE